MAGRLCTHIHNSSDLSTVDNEKLISHCFGWAEVSTFLWLLWFFFILALCFGGVAAVALTFKGEDIKNTLEEEGKNATGTLWALLTISLFGLPLPLSSVSKSLMIAILKKLSVVV